MTRWDCDVKIWRGVPCSFPAFHGWPVSRFRDDDIVLSSTASLRFISCSVCYNWIPESSRYHNCQVIHPPKKQEAKIVVTEGSVYVVAKDEYKKCYLCNDRVLLQFLPDIEEWVYMDCVEHEGVPVHKVCRDIAYPTTPVWPEQESKSFQSTRHFLLQNSVCKKDVFEKMFSVRFLGDVAKRLSLNVDFSFIW